MAGNESGDLLMMVLPERKTAIPGESQSKLQPMGPLLKGFKEGFMFEISDFQFGVSTLSEAKGAGGKQAAAMAAFLAQHPALVRHPVPANVQAIAKGVEPPGTPQGEPKSCPVEPVTFRRPIDMASNKLLKLCIECKTLHGAVVVKRKPAGGKTAGEAYLRIEFKEILFIDMAWSNGDPVEERCTFITRAVNVLYRPQLPDGSLGAVKSGSWSRLPGAQEELSYPS